MVCAESGRSDIFCRFALLLPKTNNGVLVLGKATFNGAWLCYCPKAKHVALLKKS